MVEPENSFDALADLYEEARPGYPESTFQRMLDYAGIDASARLLEVGTGTGKATLPLARRGLRILGLEPGPNMARIARSRMAEFPNVQIQTTTFENWDAPRGAFDLAFIAQAFHWLPPDLRLAKLSMALRRPGTLAIFGNSETVADETLRESIREVYRRYAPALDLNYAVTGYGTAESSSLQELYASPLFTDVQCDIEIWEQTLATDQFCSLLATYSNHSTLPPQELRDLLAGIAAIIEPSGGKVSLAYKTGLFLARTV